MSVSMPSEDLIEALRETINGEQWNVRRVVIDIEAGQIPVVHIEQYGDDSLIRVMRALDGVRIERGAPVG